MAERIKSSLSLQIMFQANVSLQIIFLEAEYSQHINKTKVQF